MVKCQDDSKSHFSEKEQPQPFLKPVLPNPRSNTWISSENMGGFGWVPHQFHRLSTAGLVDVIAFLNFLPFPTERSLKGFFLKHGAVPDLGR